MMSCVCCSESPSFTGLAASMLRCSPIRMYINPAAPAACASPVYTHIDTHEQDNRAIVSVRIS